MPISIPRPFTGSGVEVLETWSFRFLGRRYGCLSGAVPTELRTMSVAVMSTRRSPNHHGAMFEILANWELRVQ